MKQDVDEETGESHLAHALCCIVFLVTYEARGGNRSDWDDRSQWIFDYALTLSADKEDDLELEDDDGDPVVTPARLHITPLIRADEEEGWGATHFYPQPIERYGEPG